MNGTKTKNQTEWTKVKELSADPDPERGATQHHFHVPETARLRTATRDAADPVGALLEHRPRPPTRRRRGAGRLRLRLFPTAGSPHRSNRHQVTT